MAYINGKYQFKDLLVVDNTYPSYTYIISFLYDDNVCSKITFTYRYVSDSERYYDVEFFNGTTSISSFVYNISLGNWVGTPPIIDIQFQELSDTNFNFLARNLKSYNDKMTINLYYMSCEKNRIHKANYLTFVALLQGTLKDSTSILTPAISLNLPEFVKFNYAYIPSFERYYFLTDMVSIKNDLWLIRLSVDVLYSFEDSILSNTALIDRCEDTSYINKMIPDDLILEDGVDISFIELDNDTNIDSTANLDYNIVLSVLGDTHYGS